MYSRVVEVAWLTARWGDLLNQGSAGPERPVSPGLPNVCLFHLPVQSSSEQLLGSPKAVTWQSMSMAVHRHSV